MTASADRRVGGKEYGRTTRSTRNRSTQFWNSSQTRQAHWNGLFRYGFGRLHRTEKFHGTRHCDGVLKLRFRLQTSLPFGSSLLRSIFRTRWLVHLSQACRKEESQGIQPYDAGKTRVAYRLLVRGQTFIWRLVLRSWSHALSPSFQSSLS